MEDSQAPGSGWLGRFVRGPERSKVRPKDTLDHLHPGWRTRKCQGVVLLAFAHQGGWIEGCISPRARGGSPKGPSTPSRCPLFTDCPPPPCQLGARAPSGRASFPAPFHIPLPQAGGKSLGTKVSLCFGPSPPSASTSSYSSPGPGASSLEWVGVKEGIMALPLPHPPLHHLLSDHQSGVNCPTVWAPHLACTSGPSPRGWPLGPR